MEVAKGRHQEIGRQVRLQDVHVRGIDPPVFKWYLKTFGKDVNLFIDHSQVVEFAAWRTKLWGDSSIWKGKKLHYGQWPRSTKTSSVA